jgi:hypothetical protein
MIEKKSGVLAGGVLLLFLCVLLTINFFHTENKLHSVESCPACHFLQSSLSVGPAVPIQLPPLLLVAILPFLNLSEKMSVFCVDLVSRSPPLS